MTTEAQEQMNLIKRAKYHPILKHYLYANANGGYRQPREASNLVKQGVMAGVADLFLAYPVLPYHGMFIELKRRYPTKGIISAEQAIFLNRMATVNYATHVAYGADEAWAVAMQYLDGKFEQK